MLRDRRLVLYVLASLAAISVAVLALRPLLGRFAGARLRAAAAARGLDVSWRSLRVELPASAALHDLVMVTRAGGDTLFRAESLGLALDPWALLVARPRVKRIALSHATVRMPTARAADPDTLSPDDGGRKRRQDPERGRRMRRSAESLARLLVLPARRLPRLALRDVTLLSGRGADALWRGAQLIWLDLAPARGGVALQANGAILGEREVPFQTSVAYSGDDRLSGGARFEVPDPDGGPPSPVSVTVNGVVSQNRRSGTVVVADSSRITIGQMAFRVGGSVTRRGPAVRLSVAVDGLTEDRLKRSLPRPVLGPLLELGTQGSWDYMLTLSLDLARPDSVEFTADVVPHGLRLDPGRTRLRLFGLDEPFVATIHLPRDRVVTRDLSPANPHFRPLDAIAPALVSAVVTNEDGGFFRHRGFNTEAVKGAIADNLKAGAFRRGAGTITMQFARNLYLGHERTLARKFQEVVLAWVIEHLTGLSKPRLLEIYLNVIEWGPGVHGADEAARYYFDRDAGGLTVDQALFLSTVIPAPTKWRYRFDDTGALREFAQAQMHFIGRAMVAKGWIAPEQLPPAESLRVELAGAARTVLFPSDSSASARADARGP